MKKQVLFLSLLALLAVFVVALPIAAQDPTPTPMPVPSATPALGSFGQGGTQISFVNGLSGSDGVTLNGMIEQFVQENPDISVQTETIVWDTMYQRLQASLVAGDAPDVVVMHVWALPQYASIGGLLPLNDWIGTGEGQIDPANFTPLALENASFGGTIYGLPLDFHGFGTYVNNDLFEAAGLDPSQPPQTYEEYVEMATALTLDANGNNPDDPNFDPTNVVQWGTTTSWMRVVFLSALAQNGGRNISDDGTTVQIDTEAGRAALQAMYDLIYTHRVAPPPAGFDNWQSFAAGRIGIMPEGSWFRNFATIDNPQLNWTPWPMVPLGEEPAVWMSSHLFAVPVTTTGAQLEAVRRFVTWLSDNNIAWADSGQIPARLDAQAALAPETYPSNIQFAEAFNAHGVYDYPALGWPEMVARLDAELDAVLNGQKSVEQGLADAQQQMQEILARTG
ncbi:MAG: ABC transporter substrate-binding protein [bacterium]|nr:ABC transporter substrate-binding protein [bacterium]